MHGRMIYISMDERKDRKRRNELIVKEERRINCAYETCFSGLIL